MRTINQAFKNNFVRTHTRIRDHKNLARSMLNYGRWDESKIAAVEVKCLKRTAGCIRLDCKNNLLSLNHPGMGRRDHVTTPKCLEDG